MESAPQPRPQPRTQPQPQPQHQQKPILQKPPGYRDPNDPRSKPPLPPRKPVLPPSFQQKKKRRNCCRICCCTCCITIIVLIFAFIMAAGLIYIIYDPSLPEIHLGTFRVPKLNITDTGDGAYLDVDTVTRVEVKNRNSRMVWRFRKSSVQISAENGDLNLGSTKVPGFIVKEKDMTELKAQTRVRDQALDERQRRRLKGKFHSKALMPTVEVRTRTGVGMDGWKSPMVGITVVCGDVTMRQLERGDMPKCSLTLFKWIKIG